MKDLIGRTIKAMGISGITVQDIHDMLIGEGLSEYEAWLTYKAAQLIISGRKS